MTDVNNRAEEEKLLEDVQTWIERCENVKHFGKAPALPCIVNTLGSSHLESCGFAGFFTVDSFTWVSVLLTCISL